MLGGRRVNVTLIQNSGGTSDEFTRETVAGGSTTNTTVSVCWVSAPVQQAKFDRDTGRFLGTVQVADAALLYDDSSADALDWQTLLRPDVTVRHGTTDYKPVSVGLWSHRNWQVVRLKKVEL